MTSKAEGRTWNLSLSTRMRDQTSNQRFFFRYRNHPKNLLVSYLSTHPTSYIYIHVQGIYIWTLPEVPKNVGNEQKKDVRPADLIQPRARPDSTTLRINVWTEGGWWDGYYHGELKTLQSWRIHVLLTSHNHLIFLFYYSTCSCHWFKTF